jgi:hypothetical protein
LSRVINPDSAGKERGRLSKAIVVAVRELALLQQPGPESRDLAAFISMTLAAIAGTIELSVAAWEKRGYWVKADKFRMEWAWAENLSKKIIEAALLDDWGKVALVAAQIAERLSKVTIPIKSTIGNPWVGAWKKIQQT